MAKAKKKAEPQMSTEKVLAKALVGDLAAGLEAMRSTDPSTAALPPSSVGEAVRGLSAAAREQARAGAEAASRRRAESLSAELEALHADVRALESPEPLVAPEHAAGKRVTGGTVTDSADGVPLPAVAVVLHREGDPSALLAATATDEAGRFQLVVEVADAEAAAVAVLDAYGGAAKTVDLPGGGDDLRIEVDARARLPQSRAAADVAARLRAGLLAASQARAAQLQAQLRVLGGE